MACVEIEETVAALPEIFPVKVPVTFPTTLPVTFPVRFPVTLPVTFPEIGAVTCAKVTEDVVATGWPIPIVGVVPSPELFTIVIHVPSTREPT
jgi:hypothetical protein